MIVNIKRFVLKLVIGVELFIFGYVCLYGKHGLYSLQTLAHENNTIAQKIATEETVLQTLKTDIAKKEQDPFFYERIAREQLHMARSSEIVYHIPKDVAGSQS